MTLPSIHFNIYFLKDVQSNFMGEEAQVQGHFFLGGGSDVTINLFQILKYFQNSN